MIVCAATVVALTDQACAKTGEGNRDDEPSDAGNPAERVVDRLPERTGNLEVHTECHENAERHKGDAEELVLTPRERLAHRARRSEIGDGLTPA